jgi:hypothetical protein
VICVLFIGFVTKEKVCPSPDEKTDKGTSSVFSLDVYKVFTLDIRLPEEQTEPKNFGHERSRQIMIQFLYRKKEHIATEKFLLFMHQECKCI